jgi:di/tricarboxylate transporter
VLANISQPLRLFPLLNVIYAKTVAANYGHNYVLMLIAGFFIAKAIELHGLHRRIALAIISRIGTSRRLLVLSFMVATAFLSMWIANVAVTLLMLPSAPEISFFHWMLIGIPLVIIFLPITWLYLVKFHRISGTFSGSDEVIQSEMQSLGPMSRAGSFARVSPSTRPSSQGGPPYSALKTWFTIQQSQSLPPSSCSSFPQVKTANDYSTGNLPGIW